MPRRSQKTVTHTVAATPLDVPHPQTHEEAVAIVVGAMSATLSALPRGAKVLLVVAWEGDHVSMTSSDKAMESFGAEVRALILHRELMRKANTN